MPAEGGKTDEAGGTVQPLPEGPLVVRTWLLTVAPNEFTIFTEAEGEVCPAADALTVAAPAEATVVGGTLALNLLGPRTDVERIEPPQPIVVENGAPLVFTYTEKPETPAMMDAGVTVVIRGMPSGALTVNGTANHWVLPS